MSVSIIRADSRHLPLADNSVDLVTTSPPYFGLRSYQDGGEHYDGQVGDEATPAEFLDALLEVTAECVRVLKPSGSMWVNLGDKYAGGGGQWEKDERPDPGRRRAASGKIGSGGKTYGFRPKSLMGLPWRYAIRCVDELGLILRSEVIWSKPNGLPESVTDRVRRSHEQWFHFTLEPRYYSAVDEVREEHKYPGDERHKRNAGHSDDVVRMVQGARINSPLNPLGKLPGSVWNVPTEPLDVPAELGVDHFAAFPTELPRRIIAGWSPRDVCTACGEGRRPVTTTTTVKLVGSTGDTVTRTGQSDGRVGARKANHHDITGYACACPDTSAPSTRGVVLDPFGGTGTTALVATALGRHGITVDMSADYCRLATWRTSDPKQLAKAARKPFTPSAEVPVGQTSLLDMLDGEAS